MRKTKTRERYESGQHGPTTPASREHHGILPPLMLSVLFLGLGRGLTLPVLPVIARDQFGVGAATAVFVFIAPMLGSILATLPIGHIVDRIGCRKILIAAPFIIAASSFLVFIAGSYTEMLIYLLISGAALQMWRIGRLMLVTDAGVQESRGRIITTIAGLNRTGMLLGPFIGGAVSTFVGQRVPFAMYSFMALLATFIIAFFVNAPSPRATVRSRTSVTKSNKGISSWRLLLTTPAKVLFTAQFTANLARGAASGNAGPAFIFASYAYGLTAVELGSISLIGSIAAIPITFLAGYIMDRFGRKRTVVPASAALGVGLGLMMLTAILELPLAVFVISFVLANLAVSFMSGSMQTIASDIAPAESMGKFFGMSRLIASSGGLANPLVFAASLGAIAVPGGYAFGFAVMGTSAILTSALIGKLLDETLVR